MSKKFKAMKTKIYIGDTIYVGCKCAEAVKVADAPLSETEVTQTEEQPSEKPKRHRPQAKPLLPGLREQFIEYFMNKYPITKKITLRKKGRYYRVRVYYKAECLRTFCVWAHTYEMLTVKMRMWYEFREIPSAHGW